MLADVIGLQNLAAGAGILCILVTASTFIGLSTAGMRLELSTSVSLL